MLSIYDILDRRALYSRKATCGVMSNINNLEEMEAVRVEKGRFLAENGFVRKINTKTIQLYKVRSESKDLEYSVVQKQNGETFCDCPDFQHRGVHCKHIFAVAFSLTNKKVAPKPKEKVYYDGE